MADTDSQAFQALVRLQRQMSPGEKLAQVLEMAAGVMGVYRDQVRKQYPRASKREVFLRAAARNLGRETMVRIYGWDPDGGTAA